MRFFNVLIPSAALLISVGVQAAQKDGPTDQDQKEDPAILEQQVASADFDDDGVINQDDNCVHVFNPDQSDWNYDNVGNVCDNCTLDANYGQEDANADGFGNRCDGDLNDDLIVGGPDFGIFTECLNMPGEGVSSSCKIADFDSDHKVDSVDFQIWEGMFGLPPGPSGLFP
jgi:hypothetical protein